MAMSWQVGPEFRQGAENPPLWEDEDNGEELPRWYPLTGRDQPLFSTESLEDQSSEAVVLDEDSGTVDPALLEQRPFSAPPPEA